MPPPPILRLTAPESANEPVAKRSKMGSFGLKGPGVLGGFTDLCEGEAKEQPYDSITSSPCVGGRLGALVTAENTDKANQPKCSWWQLSEGGGLVGPVISNKLDLALLPKDTVVVALVAEVMDGNKDMTREFDSLAAQKSIKAPPPWLASLKEPGLGKEAGPKELLKLRRSGGVHIGGVWFVGILVRVSATGTDCWRAEAVDEVYPATRIGNVLSLRCKQFLPGESIAAPAQESPGDAAARMLREAMESMK